MRARTSLYIGIAAILGLAAGAGADTLRYDPFVKPSPDGALRSASSGEAWRPILRSALLSGDASMVNLGGRILRVGEETEGYRLVEVRRFEATFERGGEHITLPIAKETTR